MIVLWIAVGVLITTVAFFIPAASIEIWPSLNTAGIAAAIYLLALILYILRHPIPLRHSIFVGACSLVYAVALFFHWTGMQTTTSWQAQRLQDIQSTITRGIIEGECPQKLISVLEKYHRQGKGKKTSLGQVFLLTFPHSVAGSNIHEEIGEQDSVRFFVTTLSDSLITITGSHAYARGRLAAFVPYWGRAGSLQERYILTVKGVRHESDN